MIIFRIGFKELCEVPAVKILIGVILVLVGTVLFRVAVTAQEADMPPREPNLSDQWDEQTQTLLAAAVVGEAGWRYVVDHDAIPWLLYRRWRRNPNMPFRSLVTTYCKALNGKRPWLLELNAEGNQPANWPSGAAWPKHREWWLAARERVGRWARGEVADPCRADHFGGGMDAIAGKNLVPARCVGVNKFYRVTKGG